MRSVAVSLALGGALFVAAQMRVPLPWTPVPITLQTLVVYLGAAWLGSGRAVAGTLIYAGAGAAGLPVLAGWRGGLAAFTGPTGGYVAGMILAAFLLGRVLGGRPASAVKVAASFAAAAALVFLCGMLHFVLLSGASLEQALWMAFLPFLPGEGIKIMLATVAYRGRPDPMGSR